MRAPVETSESNPAQGFRVLLAFSPPSAYRVVEHQRPIVIHIMPFKNIAAPPLVACAMSLTLVHGARNVMAREVVATQPAVALSVSSATNAGPRIQFAAPIYDFGKVVWGDVVRHDFFFTNTGNGLLVIKDVRSTCGCASATNTTREVQPGNEGIISVEFHTSNFNGLVTKAVTVYSNDTNQPVATLELKGNVWRPIEITPPSAAFTGILDSPTNNFRVVRIVNNQQQSLILSLPESNQRMIAAELKTNQLGQDYQLVVRLVPPLGSGNIFGEIKMKTSAPQMPLLTIPVWAVPQLHR